MQLIDRIEINYFRSVYSISASKLKSLNVFIGPNDAGKSNILRALNLFFNNEAGYDEELRFLQDVTHLRQTEARDAKGRLTIWIKVHFNNVEGWRTLPDKFFIKKTWNRYSDFPEISSDVENKQSLTKFQNKLCFFYVPAIKEKDIFSYYINLLYETLADREGIEFAGPADALSLAVNSSIIDLTQKIRGALSVDSAIQIPNDLESIFDRLEFYTDQDSFRVPLTRRGDGLQVRHIPHILQYISSNNKKLNVWAYEEPENSLELSNAFSLASEFEGEFSIKNQIFMTSHSPAFYSLSNDRTRHFLVNKVDRSDAAKASWVTELRDLESDKIADAELGVAKLIASRSQEAYHEIESLRMANKELSAIRSPVVLTEGKTDAIILSSAWNAIYPNEERGFEFRSCDLGGASGNGEYAGADELKKILESTIKDQFPVRIGLFDRDEKGIKCFRDLKKHNPLSREQDIKINVNKCSAAIILPETKWGSPFDDFLSNSVSIEMLLPFDVYEDTDFDYEFWIGGKKISRASGESLIARLSGSPDLFGDISLTVKPRFKGKLDLANRSKKISDDKFHNFRALFDNIKKSINLLRKN